MTRPTPPRHPLGWLEQSPGFRALTDRAQRLLALQSDLAQCAPARGLSALELEDGTLVVGTPGAAAAAKLRQLEPTIVGHLAARGWNVRRIRFRPMPVGMVAPLPPLQPRGPIPADALRALQAMSSEAANESLRAALERLVRRRTTTGRAP